MLSKNSPVMRRRSRLSRGSSSGSVEISSERGHVHVSFSVSTDAATRLQQFADSRWKGFEELGILAVQIGAGTPITTTIPSLDHSAVTTPTIHRPSLDLLPSVAVSETVCRDVRLESAGTSPDNAMLWRTSLESPPIVRSDLSSVSRGVCSALTNFSDTNSSYIQHEVNSARQRNTGVRGFARTGMRGVRGIRGVRGSRGSRGRGSLSRQVLDAASFSVTNASSGNSGGFYNPDPTVTSQPISEVSPSIVNLLQPEMSVSALPGNSIGGHPVNLPPPTTSFVPKRRARRKPMSADRRLTSRESCVKPPDEFGLDANMMVPDAFPNTFVSSSAVSANFWQQNVQKHHRINGTYKHVTSQQQLHEQQHLAAFSNPEQCMPGYVTQAGMSLSTDDRISSLMSSDPRITCDIASPGLRDFPTKRKSKSHSMESMSVPPSSISAANVNTPLSQCQSVLERTNYNDYGGSNSRPVSSGSGALSSYSNAPQKFVAPPGTLSANSRPCQTTFDSLPHGHSRPHFVPSSFAVHTAPHGSNLTARFQPSQVSSFPPNNYWNVQRQQQQFSNECLTPTFSSASAVAEASNPETSRIYSNSNYHANDKNSPVAGVPPHHGIVRPSHFTPFSSSVPVLYPPTSLEPTFRNTATSFDSSKSRAGSLPMSVPLHTVNYAGHDFGRPPTAGTHPNGVLSSVLGGANARSLSPAFSHASMINNRFLGNQYTICPSAAEMSAENNAEKTLMVNGWPSGGVKLGNNLHSGGTETRNVLYSSPSPGFMESAVLADCNEMKSVAHTSDSVISGGKCNTSSSSTDNALTNDMSLGASPHETDLDGSNVISSRGGNSSSLCKSVANGSSLIVDVNRSNSDGLRKRHMNVDDVCHVAPVANKSYMLDSSAQLPS